MLIQYRGEVTTLAERAQGYGLGGLRARGHASMRAGPWAGESGEELSEVWHNVGWLQDNRVRGWIGESWARREGWEEASERRGCDSSASMSSLNFFKR